MAQRAVIHVVIDDVTDQEAIAAKQLVEQALVNMVGVTVSFSIMSVPERPG